MCAGCLRRAKTDAPYFESVLKQRTSRRDGGLNADVTKPEMLSVLLPCVASDAMWYPGLQT